MKYVAEITGDSITRIKAVHEEYDKQGTEKWLLQSTIPKLSVSSEESLNQLKVLLLQGQGVLING